MAADNTMWYSMNLNEFYVILSALGVRRWYGFGVTDEELPASCEDVNRLLAELYKNEVISFDDAKVVLEKGYAEIFDVFKEAKKSVLSIRTSGSGKTVLSYHAGDKVVMTERDSADSSTIRMSLTSKSRWPRTILREVMDFDSISKGQARVSDDEVRTLTGDGMTAADVASLKDVVAVFDRIEITTGRTEERLTIREKGLLQYMVFEKMGAEDLYIMEGGLAEVGRFLGKWSGGK